MVKYKTRRLVLLAMLVAMEIVLSRFLSVSLSTIKIGVAFLPLAIAAILFGPLWAGFAGALADVLGAMLFPIGPYFFGFTLTQFLTGVVYGLFFHNQVIRARTVNAAVGIVCILLNLGMNSAWLYYLMRDALVAMMPVRALNSIVMVPVQVLVITLFAKAGKSLIVKSQAEELQQIRIRARYLFSTGDEKKRANIGTAVALQAQRLSEYQKARTIFCFVGTMQEVDTGPILSAAFSEGKVVCVPRVESSGEMTARKIDSIRDLSRIGSFGIREPEETAEIIKKEEIDMAFIPCAAVDRRYHRVGKGGGYYDKYLAGTSIYKAAICPSALLSQRRLPARDTDVQVDAIVTESEILQKNL